MSRENANLIVLRLRQAAGQAEQAFVYKRETPARLATIRWCVDEAMRLAYEEMWERDGALREDAR